MHSSISASRFGFRLGDRSMNSPIFTLGSCHDMNKVRWFQKDTNCPCLQTRYLSPGVVVHDHFPEYVRHRHRQHRSLADVSHLHLSASLLFTMVSVKCPYGPLFWRLWSVRIARKYENWTQWNNSLPSAFTYVIPIGMIQAITNQQVGLKYVVHLVFSFYILI